MSGAPVWSEPGYWVPWLWGLRGCAGQDQLPPVPRMSDLQMAATCAGFEGAQDRPSCKLKLAATSAGPARGMGHTKARCSLFGVCEPLRDFRKVHSMIEDRLFLWETLDIVWVGLQVGWGGVSRNHQCLANSVYQVYEASDMAPACQLCWGWAQQKKKKKKKKSNGLCQHFCLGESWSFSPHLEAR